MSTRATATIMMAGLVLAAGILAPGLARAQGGTAPAAAVATESKPIGKVLSLKGTVTIEHEAAVVVQATTGGGTKVGDFVYRGDVVQTSRDGAVSIAFTDGSTFNLSNNARIVLNEFVYDPNGKSNSTLFNMTKGTFTFIAGKVAKTGDMKIQTPVATMGIRGTTPRVEIAEDGSVSFSTLIEEKKLQPGGRASKQVTKQLKSAVPSVAPPTSPSTPPEVRIERRTEKTLNLNICRDC